MADLRYRADSQLAGVKAVLTLIQAARTTTADFTFGPTDWAAISQQGLAVSGDTDAVQPLLDAIPGLVEVDS